MKAFCAYFWIFVGRIEEKRGEFRGRSVVKEPLDDSISFLAKIPPVKLKCRRESIRHSLVRILVRFPPWNILVILRAVYTCRYTAYTRYKGFDCDGQRKWYMVESVLKLQIGSKTDRIELEFSKFRSKWKICVVNLEREEWKAIFYVPMTAKIFSKINK